MASFLTRRHNARIIIIQCLYQWFLTKNEMSDVIAQRISTVNVTKTDIKFVADTLRIIDCDSIDSFAYIDSFLNKPFTTFEPIEKAVFLLALVEIQHSPETPFKVVISEALGLLNTFNYQHSIKIVNAVLDNIAKKLRVHEQ